MAETFTFDKRTNQYRYTSGPQNGKFVSFSKIQGLIEDNIKQTQADMQTITGLLLDKKITVSTWEAAIADAIKRGNYWSFTVGRGGARSFTQRDYQQLQSRVASEYAYLRRFSQEILDGKLTPAQIKNRTAMYADSFHSTFSVARDEAAYQGGSKWERWSAKDDGSTCEDCSGKSARGWQPIGTLGSPGVGVRCRGRCRCSKSYSAESMRPDNQSILSQRDGFLPSRKLTTPLVRQTKTAWISTR